MLIPDKNELEVVNMNDEIKFAFKIMYYHFMLTARGRTYEKDNKIFSTEDILLMMKQLYSDLTVREE